MRPIKPKKMPTALENDLAWSVKNGVTLRTNPRLARAILAALEYERQRADKAAPLTKEAFLKAAEKVAKQKPREFPDEYARVAAERRRHRRG